MSSSTNERSSSGKSSSSSDTISRMSNNYTAGFEVTYEKLRSILMHPIGMLLTSFLNNMPPPSMPNEFWLELLNNTTDNSSRSLMYNSLPTDLDYRYVLAAAVRKWEGTREKQLRDTISSYLDALSSEGRLEGYGDKKENSVIFSNEENASNVQEDGRVNFIVSKESRNLHSPAKKSLVAMIEVGTKHDDWWGKKNQILDCVNLGCLYRNAISSKTTYKAI